MKIKTIMYFHSTREDASDSFIDACKKHGIEPDNVAIDNSSSACYEVGIIVEFDTDTGESKELGLVT